MMRKVFALGFLLLASSPCWAVPLPIVNVSAPDVNCVFDPSCTITVNDTSDDVVLPGGAGIGFLQSRTFEGQPGAPADGFYGYEYRIDLRNISGITFVPCVSRFSIDFGTAVSFDYDGDTTLERVYIVTSGGLGTVGPTSADKSGSTITFEFGTPVCAGDTSYFFGMASSREPEFVTAQITEFQTGDILDIEARAPALPPDGCEERPDLNDDLTSSERTQLAGLMQDFLTSPVLDLHVTTPGIHGSSLFLPWHREYVGDLENFMISEGHPEFVPFPKYDPGKPIPSEFTLIDADCSAPPSCNPLSDTTPNLPLPAGLERPDVCDFATSEDLRLGGLEGWHNGVHVTIGGAMGAFNSPAAIVFWPWHSYADDVWRSWQCCPGNLVAAFPIDTLIARQCLIRPCWPIWFRFDDPLINDPDGLTAADRRGFDNKGILAGDPAKVPGKVGGALSFDGMDDSVLVPDHPELNIGDSDVSVEGWIRTSARGLQPILRKIDDDGIGYGLFLLDGRLGFYLADDLSIGPCLRQQSSDCTFLSGPNAPDLSDGDWHHVAATAARGASGRLWVDGSPVEEFNLKGAMGSADNAADLHIGKTIFAAPGQPATTEVFFEGELDEIDLFRFVLTEDEVDGIFSADSGGKFGSMAGFDPIVEGPCLEDLRTLLVNLKLINGKNNGSLLGKLDRAELRLDRGNVQGAARMLDALENQLHGLANNINRYDRGIYHTAAHKAHQCLQEVKGNSGDGSQAATPAPRKGKKGSRTAGGKNRRDS